MRDSSSAPKPQSIPMLALASSVLGLLTGLMACSFRISLEAADTWRTQGMHWAHHHGVLGFLVAVAACTFLVWLAAFMVYRWERTAEGSGIPRVEAVVRGDLPPSRMRLLPIKFIGGVMAIGAGLTLGREGPSVHMGGNIAVAMSRYWSMNRKDLLTLIAAGAAAGLTSAFSAPLAGAVFVLEELVRKFSERTTVAVLFSSGASFLVVHGFFGDQVVFPMPVITSAYVTHAPAIAALGAICAIAAVAYNKVVLFLLRIVDSSHFTPPTIAAFIGVGIGIVGYLWPEMVGGGDGLTENALLGQTTLLMAVIVFAARFALVAVSYSARTPGGLFAPMLVLGSQVGVIVAGVINAAWPQADLNPSVFAVIGMGAFFAASVQAPVTGLVLASEMTGQVALLPPLLGACAIAMAGARIMKSEPIYEALAHRTTTAARWRDQWKKLTQRWSITHR